MKQAFVLLLTFCSAHCFFDIRDIMSGKMNRLPEEFPMAIKDIAEGLPAKTITIVRGNSTNISAEDTYQLFCLLSAHSVQVINLDIATNENKEKNYGFVKEALDVSDERTSLILCEPYECETILSELTEHNLIHRTILYLFYWSYGLVSDRFLSTLSEAMRVTVITNPRPGVFRIYYNQATPHQLHHLSLVNWWAGRLYKSPVLPPANKVYHDFKGRVFRVPVLHAPPWHFVKYNNDSTVNVTGGRDDKLLSLMAKKLNFRFRIYYNQATPHQLHHLSLVNWWAGRLYKSPVLPPANKVYHDFKGRVFRVPVLHAPPWHFVKYNNDSTVNVTGGRDDKLLSLMAKKLNFRYEYYDPPERSQGSGISGNGTFKGTLGLILKRKAEFFLGDVSMTWEGLQAVEFSFLTLADSGAFLTHAPAKLSETLAIIRPFQWEVWPLVCATLLVTGPALWVVIAAPSLWQKGRKNQLELFNNCCWFTTSLFLRQSSSKEPSSTHKARLVAVLISLGATYVIGDMYSANLTSLLARPAREAPIGTLQALEDAMRDKGYELVVERHSSSLAILQNGTGVYGRLARLMRRQRVQRVRSVEVGVRLVLARRRVAVLGGRETLYYDTERFGAHNFHLSEKLYTRYSAIALQIGCPYLDTFNHVIMSLFEAGIIAKMTMDEYKNLPEHSRRSNPVSESDQDSSELKESTGTTSQTQQVESTKGLTPVSLSMLQGAFCLLGIGHLLAALTLAIEIQLHRRSNNKKTIEPSTRRVVRVSVPTKAFKCLKRHCRRLTAAVYQQIDRALGPAA